MMMKKGRTSNNRSMKNGKRDQKPQKANGAKRYSEQEITKEESNVSLVAVVNDITTESNLNEVLETVVVDDDGASNDSYDEDEEVVKQKVENLENRIEKLEQELRVVASLEISLYSVVPDHCSSAHKLHTPARRVSRLYIHACKHYSQEKRATVARNIVSGLILVTKSCGNDISRLTFWLSNIIALREIVSHALRKSQVPSNITQLSESKGGEQSGSNGFKRVSEDCEETETFTSALEKVEYWIFSRIVESVWWQVFAPHMQSPKNGDKTNEKLMEHIDNDHDEGSFSVILWKKAFKVAQSRLCLMRGAGHECGCLPILAKMVMEKCIARVDLAMFNAILRESKHHIPTDPVSDPILDSKVLPIPSGDLSFGSGARLKNAVQHLKTR